MNIQPILKKALDDNKTSKPAEEKKKIKEIIAKINSLLKKNRIKAEVKLGGSAAKDTYLGDDFDVDIFVMFDYNKYKEENLSKLLKKAIAPLKPVLVHGSRDYYQVQKRYEIIPVIKIKKYKDIINVTDASPLHVNWVNSNVKKNKKLPDEIKLAKLFFKSCSCYGAESYIKGISGHVTDILVIYYKSFMNLIRAIAKWKDSTEIDIQKHKTILDKSKIVGPLTVIDPIQPNRNAAAAVSKDIYEILKKRAKEFLSNPSSDFFKIPQFKIEDAKKEYNLILKAVPKAGKKDVVGAKLMKAFEFFEEKLEDFNVEKAIWHWDKEKDCHFCFKLKILVLPEYYEAQGPTTQYPEHIENFKKKHPNNYMKADRIFAKVKRDITKIDAFVAELRKDSYVQDKVKSLETVR